MIGANFTHTLRRNWTQALLWGGGLALLAVLLIAMVGDMNMIASYGKIIESFPPEIMSALGASDLEALSTPDGFIAFGFFSYLLIIIALYAVNVGLDITANDEDDGMLDLVLTLPVKRWQLLVERLTAFFLITIAIFLIAFSGFWIGQSFSTLEINLGGMFLALLSMIPSTLLMIMLVVFCSVVFKRKSTALAVSIVIILTSYFVDMLAMTTINPIIQALSNLSFFTYSKSQYVVTTGLVWRDMWILLGATGALLMMTLYLFNRRDVGL